MGDRADKAYQAFFGGGPSGVGDGRGGKVGFQEDPMEKAAREHMEQVYKVAASGGYTLQDANLMVEVGQRNLDNEAVMKERLLREQNSEPVFRSYVNEQLKTSTATVQVKARQLLDPETNSLKGDSLISVHREIDSLSAIMEQRLRINAFSPDGTPLITDGDFEKRRKEIEDWGKRQKELVGSSSYGAMLEAVQKEGDLRTSIAANDLMPALTVAFKAGGNAGSEMVIKAAQNPEYAGIVVQAFPQLASLFDKEGAFQQHNVAALDKILGLGAISATGSKVDWSVGLNPKAVDALSAVMMAHPTTTSTATAAFNKVADEEDDEARASAERAMKDMGKNAPTLFPEVLQTPHFKKFMKDNPKAAGTVFMKGMEGIGMSVTEAFFNDGVPVPENIRIIAPIAGSTRFSIETDNGDVVPDEVRKIIAHQYKMMRSNPRLVEHMEKALGIPLTPEHVMEIFLNGTIPETAIEDAVFEGYATRQGGGRDVLLQRGVAFRTPEQNEALRQERREVVKKMDESVKAFQMEGFYMGVDLARKIGKYLARPYAEIGESVRELVSPPSETIQSSVNSGMIQREEPTAPESKLTPEILSNIGKLPPQERAAELKRQGITKEEAMAEMEKWGLLPNMIEKMFQ